MDLKHVRDELMRSRTPNSAKAVALAFEEVNALADEAFRDTPAGMQFEEAGKQQRAMGRKQIELLEKQLAIAETAQAAAASDAADAKTEARRAYRIAVISAVIGVAGLLLAAWTFIQPRPDL